MAYRVQDKENNIFKRNTQYQNFGGILCCSCKLCVEKNSTPTVTFKNFRPREPLYPELPPNISIIPVQIQSTPFYLSPSFSPYMEFVQDFVPNGEFTYLLDFDNFGYENWTSPDSQPIFKYAKSIKYFAFRECSGSPTSLLSGFSRNPSNDYLYNNYFIGGNFEPRPFTSPGLWDSDIFSYGCSINSGFIANGWFGSYYNNPFPFDPFYNPFIYNDLVDYSPNQIVAPFFFNKCNIFYYYDPSVYQQTGFYNYAQSFYPVHYEGYPYSYLQPCTNEQLEAHGLPTVPSPIPDNPLESGDISCLANYVQNNDFSIGVKVGADCENNISTILPPLPLIDSSNYSFQNVYPISNPGARTSSFSPYWVLPGSQIGNIQYPYPIESSVLSGNGYVLSFFQIDLAGNYPTYENDSITVFFTMNPKVRIPFISIECYPDWQSAPGVAYATTPIGSNDPCGVRAIWTTTSLNYYNSDNFDSTVLFDFYFHNTRWPERIGLDYVDGQVSSYKLYGNFGGGLFYFNYYTPYFVDYTQPYYWYINYNTFIRNVPKSGTYISNTDSGGNTTLLIKDMLFTGPTYLSQYFTKKNPLLNYTEITYQKFLSVGFQCDVEIKYRSTPICMTQQIPDRLNRIEEFKVKMENYRPYVQPNLSSRDAVSYLQNENPYDVGIFGYNPNYYYYGVTYTSYMPLDDVKFSSGAFNHVIYAPPDSNLDAEFIINKKGLLKSSVESESFSYKNFQSTVSPVSGEKYRLVIGGINGRYFANNYEREDYRNSLFVKGDESIWVTGNEVTITNVYSESDVPTSWGSRKYGNEFRKYYCIFVKKVGEEENQYSNFVQIKLANSYNDAINGIELPISNYSTNYYTVSFLTLNVKYKYFREDTGKFAGPYYSQFSPSNYIVDNPLLDNLGVQYNIVYGYPWNTTPISIPDMVLYPSSDMVSNFQFANKDFLIYGRSYSFYGYLNYTPDANEFALLNGTSHLEIISLHPLKFIAKNVLFTINSYGGISFFTYNFNYTSLNKDLRVYDFPLPNYVFNNQVAYGWFGFVCDITFEENIDEFHEHSLPQEFNQILTMDQFIQTSGVYNSKSPLNMINPEKCTHIGKVIDRKDCNCPKKWIRKCEIHETTDWKKCMSCPNYQPED